MTASSFETGLTPEILACVPEPPGLSPHTTSPYTTSPLSLSSQLSPDPHGEEYNGGSA